MTKNQKKQELKQIETEINRLIAKAENLADETNTEFVLKSSNNDTIKRYVVRPVNEERITRSQALKELASSEELSTERIKVLREVLANTTKPNDAYEATWEDSDSWYSDAGWYSSSSDC